MPPPTPLDRDAIVARAFALYVRRGRQPGHELADWYEAERQLRGEADSLAKAKQAPKSPAIVPPPAKSAATHVPDVLAAPTAKPAPAAPAAPVAKPVLAAKPPTPPPPPLPTPPPPPAQGKGKNKGGKNGKKR